MKTITLFLLLISGATLAQQPSFAVKVTGKGRPMILIHGLNCSSGVWNETTAHYAERFECHAITLPGFAGQPAIKSDSLLAELADQLAAYIRSNKLKHPVIMGHSLGGFLALQLAVRHPSLVGDLVIVSAGAFLPALSMSPTITADSVRPMALKMRAGMENLTPDQVRKTQQSILPAMMRDSARMLEVSEMALKSNPATQAQAMYELFTDDLRPKLGVIPSRILVVGDWIAYKQYGVTHQSVEVRYRDQFKAAKKVTLAISDTAKHFIFYDEPQWFFEQTDKFLL